MIMTKGLLNGCSWFMTLKNNTGLPLWPYQIVMCTKIVLVCKKNEG